MSSVLTNTEIITFLLWQCPLKMSHFPNRSFNDDVDQKVKNVFFASLIYFHTRIFFYLYQAKKKSRVEIDTTGKKHVFNFLIDVVVETTIWEMGHFKWKLSYSGFNENARDDLQSVDEIPAYKLIPKLFLRFPGLFWMNHRSFGKFHWIQWFSFFFCFVGYSEIPRKVDIQPRYF